jgi:hypothetical protein
MLTHLRGKFNNKNPKGRMISVAAALGFFGLFRVSELIANQDALLLGQDHALRTNDVSFTLKKGNFTINFCDIHKYQFGEIASMKVTLQSAKNDQKRTGHNLLFTSALPQGSLNIVQVVYDWAHTARLHPGAILMSLWDATSRSYIQLKYTELRDAIKATARAFDFEQCQFSCHSLRIGGASALRAGGAPDSLIQLLGRWHSMSTSLAYQASSSNEFFRMQATLASSQNYTADVVRLLSVKPSGHHSDSDHQYRELDLASEPN